MIYDPKPMHTQKAFEGAELHVPCPVTEELCKCVLSLPMHPYMTEEEVKMVVKELKKL